MEGVPIQSSWSVSAMKSTRPMRMRASKLVDFIKDWNKQT
ncbi:hypothetical protein D187_008528 [Cystobacter fuscus DSM 2262]|uniref:Uncharacterized protein n=1 Tax=Cystobacter fuscus (strain ATCC 25194 / DSM 2262 / NBRC 100088 / M29) TaxID=1242864 RepID=S9PD78_CYSF2|nr:hypothetical protein D187_008528 [Cystobacter fuscus DSM 2262]